MDAVALPYVEISKEFGLKKSEFSADGGDKLATPVRRTLKLQHAKACSLLHTARLPNLKSCLIYLSCTRPMDQYNENLGIELVKGVIIFCDTQDRQHVS